MLTDIPSLSGEASILVVGLSSIYESLEKMLYDYGIKKVVHAVDGYDALEKLVSISPDLILLDASLQNMTWLEFCSNLRKGGISSGYASVIAITDMKKDDERVKILKINVSGVLHKPLIYEELVESLDLLLQKNYLLKKLDDGGELIDSDYEIARNLQYVILPNDNTINLCKENYNIDIYYLYKASQALGGDYWTVKQLANSRIMVCVADFAGHGVSVAIDTFRLHNYLEEFVDYSHSPAQILSDMNDNFYRMLPTGQYLTCFLGIIDTANNILTYTGAGAPPALLSGNDDVISLDCSGTPIGAYPKAQYTEKTVKFYKNNSLIIYSDALIEINDSNTALFTKNSLVNHVRAYAKDGAQSIYKSIISCIEQQKHRFDDDLTLVLLELSKENCS